MEQKTTKRVHTGNPSGAVEFFGNSISREGILKILHQVRCTQHNSGCKVENSRGFSIFA